MSAKTVAVERLDGNPNLDLYTGFWLNLRGQDIVQVEKLWAEGKLRCKTCGAAIVKDCRPYCISQTILKDKTIYIAFLCATCGKFVDQATQEAIKHAKTRKKEALSL